jgi:hypothetical protein
VEGLTLRAALACRTDGSLSPRPSKPSCMERAMSSASRSYRFIKLALRAHWNAAHYASDMVFLNDSDSVTNGRQSIPSRLAI